MNKLMFFTLVLILGTGCVTQNKQYYWGEYENLIYKMYITPGEAEPDQQIFQLTTDIQLAKDNGKPVPPGVHAHLGMMYAAQGNIEQAHRAFIEEKTLFPESTTLVDGLISRAFGKNKRGAK